MNCMIVVEKKIMFFFRRWLKNFFFGVCVCVFWKDGFFYFGVIEVVKSKFIGENIYIIFFDDDYIVEVDEGDVVGFGFSIVGVLFLKSG